MFVQKGDKVILTDTDQTQLQPFIGKKWIVESIMEHMQPPYAIITREDVQATAYIKHLEVLPPTDSPIDYDETVKIIKSISKFPVPRFQNNEKELIGKIGKIRGYDKRFDCYLIKCPTGEFGWFPIHSLVPLDFKGERFFYPFEQVIYKDNTVTISKIKKSKFNFGQLLLIEGVWVPSTDVTTPN